LRIGFRSIADAKDIVDIHISGKSVKLVEKGHTFLGSFLHISACPVAVSSLELFPKVSADK
jgi:hypothetical protein